MRLFDRLAEPVSKVPDGYGDEDHAVLESHYPAKNECKVNDNMS